ncbi:MAG: hypothetical protein M3Z21_15860 [Pseudomonadota bacterium]|nr:hypothetical protein [Pseudomonadota bacterium]
MSCDGFVGSLTQELTRNCDRVAVIAGHYCVAPHMAELSYEMEAEQNSFKLGASLASALMERGKQAVLIVWVNDIGIAPEQRARLKSDYQLPDPYARLLTSRQSRLLSIRIFFESSMRNKASKRLRQLYRLKSHLIWKAVANQEGLVRCVNNACFNRELHGELTAYVTKGPNGEDLVLKDGPNPKCNSILATLFEEVSNTCSPDQIVTIFNDVYINRIMLGVFVAEKIFAVGKPMRSFFCDEERVFAS